jgi:4-hydroxythreonine-4-phosphate dehydrogenase
MMMVAGSLRVGLATGHIPVSAIARTLTIGTVRDKLHLLARSLRRDFGIAEPRIAVLGLNPHAGDGGVLGGEEQAVIAPALAAARAEGIRAEGPFPADGYFALHRDDHDAVLAMYHDQGLVPFKALAFDEGVNFTAGLPIVRTSPDHGTAYALAGQGRARPGSMRAAIEVALDVARHRAVTV